MFCVCWDEPQSSNLVQKDVIVVCYMYQYVFDFACVLLRYKNMRFAEMKRKMCGFKNVRPRDNIIAVSWR